MWWYVRGGGGVCVRVVVCVCWCVWWCVCVMVVYVGWWWCVVVVCVGMCGGVYVVVVCVVMVWLVGLQFDVPVNNFSVMLGRSHRFLGIYQYLGELKVSCSRTLYDDRGVRTWDL